MRYTTLASYYYQHENKTNLFLGYTWAVLISIFDHIGWNIIDSFELITFYLPEPGLSSDGPHSRLQNQILYEDLKSTILAKPPIVSVLIVGLFWYIAGTWLVIWRFVVICLLDFYSLAEREYFLNESSPFLIAASFDGGDTLHEQVTSIVKEHGREIQLSHDIVDAYGGLVLHSHGIQLLSDVEKEIESAMDVIKAIHSTKPKKVLIYGDGMGLWSNCLLKSGADKYMEKCIIIEPYSKSALMLRKRYLRQFNTQIEDHPSIKYLTTNGKLLHEIADSDEKFDAVIIAKALYAGEEEVLAAKKFVSSNGFLYAPIRQLEFFYQRGLPSCYRKVVDESLVTVPIELSLDHYLIISPHRSVDEFKSEYIRKIVQYCPPMFHDRMKRIKTTDDEHITLSYLTTGSSTLLQHQAEYHSVSNFCCNERTEWQDMTIADTHAFGRALYTDNCLQSAECDERIYHEMLIHTPCAIHGNVKRVLIGGAGEGATLRELLRYSNIEEIVTVDIDEAAIKLNMKHL
jgi:spermidine synthase